MQQEPVGIRMTNRRLPALRKRKDMLSAVNMETSQKLVTHGIHAISLLRLKYTIFQGTFPISLLKSEDKTTLPDK